jgi:hypothetical protein
MPEMMYLRGSTVDVELNSNIEEEIIIAPDST